MERTGIVLLPLFFLAAGPGADDPRAARGPHAPQSLVYRQPALRGGARPVLLRGALTDVEDAPWVVIATRPDATPRSYEALTRHLASHGCAAFAAERMEEGEPWWRYADALGTAIWQVRAELETPESPFHGRVDPACLVVIAEGDGALAVASVAAHLTNLRGVVLIDPPPPGPALPWLARVHAPFLAIATSAARSELAETWFNASGAEEGKRWLVAFETDRPRLTSTTDSDGVLQRDLRALVTGFVDVYVNLGRGVAPAFPELASRGSIDRTVRGGSASIPLDSSVQAAQR